MLNITKIPAPRVSIIDERTGLMAREWYLFFLNLFDLTGGGTNTISLQDLQLLPPDTEAILGELNIVYDQAQLAAMMAQYEEAARAVQNQLDSVPSLPQLGTLSSINENNVRMLGFNPSPSPVPGDAAGVTYWDDGNGTLVLGLKGGNVTYVTAQQQYALCYNDTASTMTKGQVVYISGAQGNRVAVKLGLANTDATSAHTIGFVAETIAAGAEGWVHSAGPLYKLNTTGLTAGDTVYLSPSVAGGWTTTKPVAPNHMVILGFVERVHATVGSIYVKVDNGYEIDELHNVKITSVANNDLLQYDSAGPYWKNVASSAVSIGTATNLAAGAAGSVPYQTGAGATTFLGIGTADQVLAVNATGTAPEWDSTTGSGNVVRATSPTLVTPALGTPSSGDLSNCINLSLATGTTGVLPVTNGGTGQTAYSTGDILYASSPTTMAKLAAGGFGKVLLSNSPPFAPAWGQVPLTTHVSGVLQVLNGGTAVSTPSITALNNITGFSAAGTTGSTSTNLVFSSAPTLDDAVINTKTRTPLVVGGTGDFSTLILRSTTGVGKPGADIIFQTGNNGATEVMRCSAGAVAIGAAVPSAKLHVENLTAYLGEILTLVTQAGTDGTKVKFRQNYSGTVWTTSLIQGQDVSGFGGNLNFYTNTGSSDDSLLLQRMCLTSGGKLGINATDKLSRLTVNGSFATSVPLLINAATYTVVDDAYTIRFTTTNCVVTLPSAALFLGRILNLLNVTANTVTSNASNVIPLGSNTPGTAILAATAGKFRMIQSDGTNWITVMSN